MSSKKEQIYIGTDVGKYTNVASVVKYEQGEENTLIESISFSNTTHGFNKFLAAIQRIKEGQRLLFGMESTGHYWMNLYYHLTENEGEDVVLVNPYDVRLETQRNKRKTKTDKISAKMITKVMIEDQLKPYNEMGIDMGLKSYTRYWDFLTTEMSRRKNKIHKVIDLVFPELRTLFNKRIIKTLLVVLETCPTPEKALELGERKLAELIRNASRGKKGKELAKAIIKGAKTSFGIRDKRWITPHLLELKHLLKQMQMLEKQRKEVKKEIEKFGGKDMELLMTIPGYGKITAAIFVAEVGDVDRFPTAKHLTSFVGLNSSVNETGEFKADKNSVTKAGNAVLRRAMSRIVYSAIKSNPELQEYVKRKKKQGKHKNVIACAVANKLLHYGYVVLKEQRPFKVKK